MSKSEFMKDGITYFLLFTLCEDRRTISYTFSLLVLLILGEQIFAFLPYQSSTLVLKCVYSPLICISNIPWIKKKHFIFNWYSKILCHIFGHFFYWNSTIFWLVSHFFIFINRCQKVSLWKMELPIFCYLHCVKIVGQFPTLSLLVLLILGEQIFAFLPYQSSTLVLKCVYSPLICISNIPWIKILSKSNRKLI